VRLADLVADVLARTAGARLVGDPTVSVTSLTHDSRAVRPGALFAAVPGTRADGHDHAPAAVAAGAVALLVERPLPDLAVPQVVVPRVRAALGPVASRLWGDPSRAVPVLGITGTNGKTTTTHLLEAIGAAAGLRTGVLGTVGARLGGAPVPGGGFTTPEAPELQAVLAAMRDDGAALVAMEVSSHALAQGRVDGTWFAAVGFTNLTHDHLDFHETMDDYFAAKARLFEPERAAAAAIHVDDPWGARLAELAAERGLATTTFGRGDGPGPAPSLAGVVVGLGAAGTDLRLEGEAIGTPVLVRLRLLGRFNVENALAAAATARAAGLPLEAVVAGLQAELVVPGRFEAVDAGQAFAVVVDYAHTPDALARVLVTARELLATGRATGRVVVVFGCGGDRDRAKRPVMGRAAAELADLVVVTSDNPRSEDPATIIGEILGGIETVTGATDRLLVEPDRRAAIGLAVRAAAPGDVVVIAGKGHEPGQTIGATTLPFDDRTVARQALEDLRCA
jgi:UDP-N-acetylmuramoyl-L-alanyl-D-glutamate--2,6-diaminopimelate ligase